MTASDLDYWLACLASATLWGVVGAAAWGVRMQISDRLDDRQRQR